MRPLKREQVCRVLDDADERVIAARVEADRADLVLGEVPAFSAESDALFHVPNRVREPECLLLGDAQEVEREPVRRPGADARKPRQLGDELLDRRAEHLSIVPMVGERSKGESGRAPLSYDSQTVAKSSAEDFAAALRERGLRPTPQRRAVWSVFEGKESGHLSADEVLQRARRTLPEIARGTVYNALGELVAANLVGTIRLGTTQLYDANLQPHEHFLCSVCGRLYDVHPQGVRRLRLEEPGFTVDRVQVLFEGTCPRCAPA